VAQNVVILDESLMICSDVFYYIITQVYGVQAYANSSAVAFYEELAEKSSGYHLELKNFNLITDMFLAGKF